MKHIQGWLRVFVLFLVTTFFSTITYAGTGAGYSEYYIPGTEQEMYTTLQGLNPAVTDNTMTAIISVVAKTDATTVYYDHWEDGYDLDPNDLAGTADEIVTLSAGQVQTFASSNIPVNPRGTAVRYDGGDHIYIVGGPVTVSRASMNTGVGPVLGMSWEVYPLKALGNEYIIPVGQDLNTVKGYVDFIRTYFLVQATEDNTQLTIVDPITGTSNVTINRNTSHLVSNNNAGTTVSSDKPVSTLIAVGDNGSNYESRGYSGIPRAYWSDTYYAPVGSFNNANTQVYVYNPNTTTLTINYEDKTGVGTFTVAPNDTLSFSDASAAGRFVAINSALTLTGDQDFWAVNSIDTNLNIYDWGHGLVPDTLLDNNYLIGWTPGSYPEPSTANGSPLFATAIQDGTTVYIDYPPADGLADTTLTLNRLDSQKIYNPNNNTMTGARIWSTEPIALVWGQDPDTASSGSPYLDMGYTTLPQLDQWIELVLSINKTADKSVLNYESGEAVTFTLNISSYAIGLSDVNVKDILPSGWSYVSGNTIITKADGIVLSGAGADPSIAGQNLIWYGLLLEGMGTNEVITIQYDAITSVDFTPGEASINQVETNATSGGAVFVASDTYVNYFVGMDVNKSSTPQNAPLLSGDTIDYNIQIINTAPSGNAAVLNNVVVSDIFPEGTTLNGSCTVNGWAYNSKIASDSFPINGDGTTGTGWIAGWSDINEAQNMGGGDIQVTGNTLRIRDDNKGASRSVDFTGFGTTAQLSFDYQRVGLDNDPDEYIAVYIDSGSGPVEIVRFDGTTGNDTDFQTFGPVNVTIGNTTELRFLSSDDGQGNGDIVYFDNIQLSAITKTPKSVPCNAFPDILDVSDDFDLIPGDDLNISYQVIVDDPLGFDLKEINNTVSVTTDEVSSPMIRTTSDPIALGSFGDLVFKDMDGDGIYEPGDGDAGIDGVIVFIDANNNGTIDAGEPNATTSAGGLYALSDIPYGDYNISVNLTTVPVGYISSTPLSQQVTITVTPDDTIDFGFSPRVDLSVTKNLITTPPFVPGQSITYTIVVSNAGPNTATDINVTDLPTNLKVSSATGPTSSCTITDPAPLVTTSVVCNIDSLAVGVSETITLIATVP